MVRETLANAARDWMAARAGDLLPVEYFHVVFTLPAEIAQIAFWNKKAVYDLLFRASAETVMTLAADPRRLGARVGMTAVLHSWGSALTHHPHIHMIVPGGGLSPDGSRWIACRPGFFLHVQVLSRLFPRLFIEGLPDLHHSGHLVFFGDHARLTGIGAFTAWLAPFRKSEWVVYAKPPFGGPEAVLAYLSRYTHHVAISNSRLVSADAATVAFRWKDYRIKQGDRQKVMRLATGEFIRRFLIHVLPPSRPIALQSPAGQRTASTASGITACWPALPARPTSRRSATCSGRLSARPRRRPRPGSSRSPCANLAPAVGPRCGSSRSSAAGKNRSHGHHHRSKPHDEVPVTLADPPPVPVRAPGSRRLPSAAQTAESRDSPPSSAPDCTNTRPQKCCPPAKITAHALPA
jgi:hypothetical protein